MSFSDFYFSSLKGQVFILFPLFGTQCYLLMRIIKHVEMNDRTIYISMVKLILLAIFKSSYESNYNISCRRTETHSQRYIKEKILTTRCDIVNFVCIRIYGTYS